MVSVATANGYYNSPVPVNHGVQQFTMLSLFLFRVVCEVARVVYQLFSILTSKH